MHRLKAILFAFCLSVVYSNAQQNVFTHTVGRGETLYSIAVQYGTTTAEIMRLNPSVTQVIKVGQMLNIPAGKQTEGNVTYHTIERGETLYKLSQKYGVSMESICNSNPGLSAESFRAGQVIRIPAVSDKNRVLEQSKSEVPQPISNCRDMHKVQRRETVYGIARQYGISEYELKEANPEMKVDGYKLKKGTYLCIPYKRTRQSDVSEHTNASVFETRTKKLAKKISNIRVALLLPLTGSSDSQKMLDFYRGFLMAVDSVKQFGQSVEVFAYNSGETASDMARVLTTNNFEDMNLVIGPLYSEQVPRLASFCKEKGIRLVVPFNRETTEPLTNSYVYQINTPWSYLYPEVYHNFFTRFVNANVLFLDGGKNDKAEFVRGFRVELANRNKVGRNISLQTDDKALIRSLNQYADNIIVPSSSDVSVLNQFFPRIKAFMERHPEYIIHLFGYPEWQTLTRTHLENFFKLDTYFFATFYSNPLERRSADFDLRFRHNFQREQLGGYPRYGMLGFDIGYYFLSGLSQWGEQFDRNQTSVIPYEMGIKMERVNNWGGFVNKNITFINYSRNHTIMKYDF